MAIFYTVTVIITLWLIISSSLEIARKLEKLKIQYKENSPLWYNVYTIVFSGIIIAIPLVNIIVGLVMNTKYFQDRYIKEKMALYTHNRVFTELIEEIKKQND